MRVGVGERRVSATQKELFLEANLVVTECGNKLNVWRRHLSFAVGLVLLTFTQPESFSTGLATSCCYNYSIVCRKTGGN